MTLNQLLSSTIPLTMWITSTPIFRMRALKGCSSMGGSVAECPSSIFVRALPVKATGPVHTNSTLVREVYDLSSRDLLGLVILQLIDDRHDPAMFFHDVRIISMPAVADASPLCISCE